jgi:hypothetical protein
MRLLGQEPEVPRGARGVEESRQPLLEPPLAGAGGGREAGDRSAAGFGLTAGRDPQAGQRQEARE